MALYGGSGIGTQLTTQSNCLFGNKAVGYRASCSAGEEGLGGDRGHSRPETQIIILIFPLAPFWGNMDTWPTPSRRDAHIPLLAGNEQQGELLYS